ncbi:MAG: hypothetical protein HYR96_05515 [Deltaproteobacteria bacterium]|nr:hypothetical protein [Deltaproteobacteria bacterium]MBI3294865.1 hypothetical protein [Deltaproteobacteria bacterium]
MKLAFEGVLKPPVGKRQSWGVGVPILGVFSQGRTRADALKAIVSAVREAAGDRKLKVSSQLLDGTTFALFATDSQRIMSFMLAQQRSSVGLTVRAASKKLGSNSPNTFGRYESGWAQASLEKLVQLVGSVSDQRFFLIKLV